MKKINQAAVSYRENLIEFLRGDEEAQIEYIRANFEDNGDMPAVILTAIRTVAEARGFKHFAEEAGLNRENLYRVLSLSQPHSFHRFRIDSSCFLRTQ